MAPPILAENEDADHQQSKASEDAQLVDFLASKTLTERMVYFRRPFFRTVVPIQSISEPELCQKLPDFAEDITTAYLQHTTFTAKVWVNYDAACKKFYDDTRAEDCGQLLMKPKDNAYLQKLDPEVVQLGRVRLEVGTAFNTLCYITLRLSRAALHDGGEVIARCKPETGEHPELINFLRSICNRLNESNLREGQTGFQLADLEEIASMLRRKPSQADIVRKGYFAKPSPWMDLDSWERNTGWLDFKAIGKGCWQQLCDN